MNYITLEPTEFAKFAAASPYKSFMQTPEIAKLRERNGWTPYYYGVEVDGKIKAATMLVARPTFLGKSTFLAPGGPLLDLEDSKLTNFFFKNLIKYIKSHNGYVLHIDPYYEQIERDRDGNKVEDGFNHQDAVNNLAKNGFKPTQSTQPKYLFVMDLNNRTEEQLLANLKRNTRNHIRKAEKAGVTVRELKREELPILKQITESTSKRRNFTDRPLSYYEHMYDLFHDKGEIKFLLAEARIGKKRSGVNDGVSETVRDDGSGLSEEPRNDGRDEASRGNTILTPLSAAMFMLYGDEVIYLFSGSDEQYMKEYNAQYAIQWHIIKYAAEHKFKRYNFYGIHDLPKNGELDGIYEFKKGFDTKYGHVVELIGSYELGISQPFYKSHQFLSKLRHS